MSNGLIIARRRFRFTPVVADRVLTISAGPALAVLLRC